jgi:maleate cis-trans isomerase
MSASSSKHLGFLYPGHAAEDDYPYMGGLITPPAMVTLRHTEFIEDAHTVEALSEMGSTARLVAGACQLTDAQVDAVLWTSTSASFVLGEAGIREQIAALENALNVPASTTAMAFLHAIKAIGARRVAIAAPYPEDIALRFRVFLEGFNIDVVRHKSRGIFTAAEVGLLEKNDVIQFAVDNDHPDADVLLIPDTALHSAAWVGDIEAALGKPVLTANQVSFWEALRLCGGVPPQSTLGRLFELGFPGG